MEKVVVGMSGGVDSSVAAYLLQKKGYEVIGVTMEMWSEDKSFGEDLESMNGSKANEEALTSFSGDGIEDAKRVADYLGIPHYVLDFRKEFRDCIVDNFIEEYRNCRTPNPCIRCNRLLKWEALLQWAKEHGISKIATGHYARIIQLKNGRYTVTNAVSEAKDQTYALCRLTQEQLAVTLMPVGEYSKDEIRRIAKEAGIPVAEKPDSQDICFIPDGDYAAFIQRNAEKSLPGEGNFVDKEGKILGRHKGLVHYTIGQRKGLNLAMGEPVFVTALRPETGEVVIGKNEDVFSDSLLAKEMNYMALESFGESLICDAKIRYAHKGARCKVLSLGGAKVKVVFEEPQRAITPGQSVVFYGEEEGRKILLGGGIIC